MGNLTGLLDKIKPALEQVPASVQPRNSKNPEFCGPSVQANVHTGHAADSERGPILREMLDQGRIRLAGGQYDLSTGKVHFYDK